MIDPKKHRAIGYFANGIGNFIMMMPALKAVASMAGGKIDLLIPAEWRDVRRQAVMEIAGAWGSVGKIFGRIGDGLKPQDYDTWFYSPHGTNYDAAAIFKSRMGHVPIARPAWRDSLAHERSHYMDIARAIGYSGPEQDPEFPILKEAIIGEAKRPIIGICDGAFNAHYWRKKKWPFFGDLARTLKGWFGGTIVAIGGEGELAGVAVDRNLVGKKTILQTARAISEMDLLITTDTGNMHIADAIGIPLIALFGSTLVSKNGPIGKKSSILASGLDCAPCQDTHRFMNCQKAVCMEEIRVGDVMALARKKLEGQNGDFHGR